MAKQMVYFNATKQIETITIHYNNKLDGTFVEDVAKTIKDVAGKMSKVNLKVPKEFETIKVFVYPSKNLFYQIFGGEIEKRFYHRKRSLEDLYVVQDSEGNIHIVSPRGLATEKREAFKKILVMKVLGEYMEENEKQKAERLLKEAMKPKEQVKDMDDEEIQADAESEIDEPNEEIESKDEEELEELSQDEFEEVLETQTKLDQIDEEVRKAVNSDIQKEKEHVYKKRSELQEWLSVGWMGYVNGRLRKKEQVEQFANNISKNGIKKLSQLSNTKLLESYNYSREYACAWVEYIVETYGKKKFAEHYENPKDIKGVFGVPKFIFECQLKTYIKEKYKAKDDEKLKNMLQDIRVKDVISEDVNEEREQVQPISQLTQVHFEKSGGVVMLETVEMNAPTIKERE